MIVFMISMTGAALFGAVRADAQDNEFVGYEMDAKSEIVEGTMLVDGYAYQKDLRFVGQDGSAGRASYVTCVDQPKPRRGNVFQTFRSLVSVSPARVLGLGHLFRLRSGACQKAAT